jgi:hypothetical protein
MIEYTVKVWANGGDKQWRLNGKLHREDGPADERSNGDKYWSLNGKLHREDGPAIEYADGHKEWFLNGKRHREDGPAIEYANGDKSWFLNDKRNGERLTEEEFNERMAPTVEMTMEEICKALGKNVKVKT